jgi:hypothetical protein
MTCGDVLYTIKKIFIIISFIQIADFVNRIFLVGFVCLLINI